MTKLSEILGFAGPRRLFCDFDGTLARIVDDPAQVVPVAGAVELLEQISEYWDTTAIVSGRPVSFLDPLFSNSVIDLFGLYGLESRIDGKPATRVEHHSRWSDAVAAAAEQIASVAPAGVSVELKGLSMTTHFRAAPEQLQWVLTESANAASNHGLELREARMSVELHPSVAIDKGTTVRDASPTLGASVYVGDDVGDLAAFIALRELREQGHLVLCVAVASEEVPDQLIEQADQVLEGPDAVLEFLKEIAQGDS